MRVCVCVMWCMFSIVGLSVVVGVVQTRRFRAEILRLHL